MLLTEQSIRQPVDVSGFVTYMAPEFLEDLDDGTDLAVPDIESLRPVPRPDDRKRRRPGRSESRPDDAAPAADTQTEDFAAGIDGVSPLQVDSETESTSTDAPGTADSKSAPRRHRRRRGRDRDVAESAGATERRPDGTDDSRPTGEVSKESDRSESSETSATTKPRRRRGRRRRGKGAGGSSDAPTTPPE